MTHKTYWKRLQETGWLRYVPTNLHEELRGQIQANLASTEPHLAFGALVQGTIETGADTLEDALETLRRMSHGKFQPAAVLVEVVNENNDFQFSFHHGNKTYSAVAATGDYTQTLLELVNQAMAESDVEERFIELPPMAFANLVFVLPSVHQAAVKATLIPKELPISPGDAEILADRTWFWATCSDEQYRDGNRAVEEGRRILKVVPTNGMYMEILAAAYAETGDFEKAVHWQMRALEDPDRSKIIKSQERLKLYQNGQPYRMLDGQMP